MYQVESCFSDVFAIRFGVRLGSVLSPFLLDDIPVFRSLILRSFVVMYADDILLIAPSVSELQRFFQACECELNNLDMCLNVKKSCCIRIGPRNDFGSANIITSTGLTLPWVREIRYLGSYLTAGRQFRCSVSYAKRYFYRATNAIFGKIGRFVSEEVLIELVRCK